MCSPISYLSFQEGLYSTPSRNSVNTALELNYELYPQLNDSARRFFPFFSLSSSLVPGSVFTFFLTLNSLASPPITQSSLSVPYRTAHLSFSLTPDHQYFFPTFFFLFHPSSPKTNQSPIARASFSEQRGSENVC